MTAAAGDWAIHQGDALEVLRTLPAESVQTCVTSPPYWGLRDYGVDGQLGLEPTIETYVAAMVEVFREVRRVLRRDGVLWLNLGDMYIGAPHGGMGATSSINGRPEVRSERTIALRTHCKRHAGLKPKDLVGMPWRIALALQADGWWLRGDIIWHKPNAQPEAVKDRPTRSHEYIFQLAKASRYYYDQHAIAEPVTGGAKPRGRGVNPKAVASSGTKDAQRDAAGLRPSSRLGRAPGWRALDGKNEESGDRRRAGFNERWRVKQNESFAAAIRDPVDTRNARSVWTIRTHPFPGAHFATFPPKLAAKCILAASRPGDVVLDHFAGAGTTGLVALRLGRAFVGVEINPEYVEMARQRILADAPLLNRAGVPPEAA
jgi:site-specific DNA-methyltransferase (cytosine-N4-specific)